MSETRVQLNFARDFEGTLEAARGKLEFSDVREGAFKPYDLMLGALGACYYHTFVGIADKMKLDYTAARLAISGVKRTEVPATLKTVDMVLTIKGAAEEKGFERAAQLSAKYCSVHETISKVADISLKLEFED